MSRRTSSSRPKHSDGTDIQAATTCSLDAVAGPVSAPSLESLLASCGALKSVIRQNDNDVASTRIDDSTDHSAESANDNERQFYPASSEALNPTETEAAADTSESTFDPNGENLQLGLEDSPTVGNRDSSDIVSLLNSLRHEFCAAIDELKSAQTAAAAGQSAVLKAMFEVISRSTSMQSGSSVNVEQQLADFEERIINRISQMSDCDSVAEPSVKPRLPDSKSFDSRSTNTSANRSWAEIRDDLLLNGDDREAHSDLDESEPARQEEEQSDDASASPEETCILEVPDAVDPETLSDLELREAFLEREAFISTLISRLRQSYQQSSGHLPAEKLKSMAEYLPADLAAQVLQTLQQLDEIARIGELELSLERASLSRQLSKLHDSRQLIDHHARQLGLTLTDDGTVSNPPKSANRGSGSRRWLSKLGFGQ